MNITIQDVRNRLERDGLSLAKKAVQTGKRILKGVGPRQVIFVSGVQRSGTNMVTDVLARSFETDVFNENHPRSHHDFQLREDDVIRELVAGSKARFVVFKVLCEAEQLGRLLDEFAPAKAIWCLRHYNDMVNSHLRLWSGCPATIGKIVEDPNSAGWRGRGMSAETRELVARMHKPEMNDASAVALFWYFRNILFLEQGFDRDDRVLAMAYEDLVTGARTEFRRLYDFVGLKYSPWVSKKVHARSIAKNAAPDIEPRIKGLCDAMLARLRC
ncbi:MAG: sulfotransferase domain-containing protein [Sphingomonadales bacterium]